jgi:magnesium chelatase subunit I
MAHSALPGNRGYRSFHRHLLQIKKGAMVTASARTKGTTKGAAKVEPKGTTKGAERAVDSSSPKALKRAVVAPASSIAAKDLSRRPAYPFTALVGQHEMQRGLLIATVDPLVGGVLILGDRGTGKSTAVRALADVLPEIQTVKGCPYQCDPTKTAGLCGACSQGVLASAQPSGRASAETVSPSRPASGVSKSLQTSRPVPVVDLPLGSSEDRVLGALDLEKLMTLGEKAFEPGLLAKANRGFLYIDEINLLEDHLVDLLIDAAASGENRIEREGLSIVHPSRFVLVGSGNPEEGELRPQLLDRFGLAVEVRTPRDLDLRVQVVLRREAFERDPEAFLQEHAQAQAELSSRLVSAQKRLSKMELPASLLRQAADLCMRLGTDGLRGELSLIRAAKAAAALDGLKKVTLGLLREVAPMALRHRLRRDPLDDTDASARVARVMDEVLV